VVQVTTTRGVTSRAQHHAAVFTLTRAAHQACTSESNPPGYAARSIPDPAGGATRWSIVASTGHREWVARQIDGSGRSRRAIGRDRSLAPS
jgi:hypothetical protein